MKNRAIGELALIERIRRDGRGRRAAGVAFGIGDDCAILRPPANCEVLVTTDFSLEGRHFRRDLHPADAVGHRCLARGLSDLAAMGAAPMAAFLSLALPGELLSTAKGQAWVKGFFRGLRRLADRYGIPLAGGDTAQSPNGLVLADIVLVGQAPAGRALRRGAGRAGDALYCTGSLGGAAAELEEILRKGKMATSKPLTGHPHLYPQPRIAVGVALRRRGLANACIDLSDGLSTDLRHLCSESQVGAEIVEAALPIHPLAANLRGRRALELALNGGEDYELLFSGPAGVKMPRRIAGVQITWIGRLVKRTKGAATVTLVGADGCPRPLSAGGWEHFAVRGKL